MNFQTLHGFEHTNTTNKEIKLDQKQTNFYLVSFLNFEFSLFKLLIVPYCNNVDSPSASEKDENKEYQNLYLQLLYFKKILGIDE